MKKEKKAPKNKKLLTIIFSILFLIISAGRAFAICEGPLVPCGREGTPPCKLCHLFQLLSNVLEFTLTCITPITAILMLTIGGVMFMLSNLEILSITSFSQAKEVFTAVIVGLFVTFVAWVFLNTFLTTIGIAEWTGLEEWWEIECIPSGSYNEAPDFVWLWHYN